MAVKLSVYPSLRTCSSHPLSKSVFTVEPYQKVTHVKGYRKAVAPLKKSVKHNGMITRSSLSGDDVSKGFKELDPRYVTAFPLDAVDIASGNEGYTIRLSTGHHISCVPVSPEVGKRDIYIPQPCIVLRLENEELTLLTMHVAEQSRNMLVDAFHGRQEDRPTVYQVVANMLELLGYKVIMVRITARINSSYCSSIYIKQTGSGKIFSLDARPSDAINLAMILKVTIQVSKALGRIDGLTQLLSPPPLSPSDFGTSLDDIPLSVCKETHEFTLVHLLTVATQEERYFDAAKLRDELIKFRNVNYDVRRRDRI